MGEIWPKTRRAWDSVWAEYQRQVAQPISQRSVVGSFLLVSSILRLLLLFLLPIEGTAHLSVSTNRFSLRRPHPTKPRRALRHSTLIRRRDGSKRGLTFWFANMYFEGYGYRGSTFEQTYRCYPASFIDKPQLETGDKIIMPPSALDRLASLHIEYPMLFEVHNAAAERISHCGVLEFIAEEGMIYMPYWMMQNLLLQEGDMVFIKNANLPKGTYVKLQPHTTDFLDISNPKAILEKTLRNYSCLTTGDSIMVAYNNKKYYIDIVETKPSSAISIIETDCEVDFAPPLDYKEPELPKPAVPPSTAPTAEAAVEEEPKFIPFSGSGRRLNEKPSKDQDASASSPAKRQANATNSVQPSTSSALQSSSSRKTTGKLVFGSGGSRSSKETDKVPEKDAKEDPKKDEPKFAAFTGKKYSLKG